MWNFKGPIITPRYPKDEIFLSWNSEVYHVSHELVSHLKGSFACEAYCASIGSRVPYFEADILEKAREYVERKLEPLPGMEDLDPGVVLTAIDRSLGEHDLLEAEYADLDRCASEATNALRTKIAEQEMSR